MSKKSNAFKTTKIVQGWGLRLQNGRMRTYGITDAVGTVEGQIAIWPLKRMAKQMALPGEVVCRLRVMYIST